MPVRHLLLPAAAISLLAAPVQAMPVREFIARWTAVGKLGEMARLDPELRRLTNELEAILEAWRADVDKAKATGKPIACPPPRGQAKFDSDKLMAYFKALSPAEQEVELKDGLYAYLNKTYPCPMA